MAHDVPAVGSRTGSAAAQRESVQRHPSRWVVLAHSAMGVVLGVALGWLVGVHLADFGSQGPLAQQLLALGANGGAAESLQQVAAESGSQLLRFAGLVLATGAAVALLFGAASGFGSLGRSRTAVPAVRIGLWLALALALLALLPLDGAPFALGYSQQDPAVPAAAEWHPVLRGVAVAAAAGLLASRILLRRSAAAPAPSA